MYDDKVLDKKLFYVLFTCGSPAHAVPDPSHRSTQAHRYLTQTTMRSVLFVGICPQLFLHTTRTKPAHV